MTPIEKVAQKLKSLGIGYTSVEHPPVFTTEEADKLIAGYAGTRTKTLLLNNSNKTEYYLVVMSDNVRLDLKKFQSTVQSTRLSMASPERLKIKLGVTPGSVSVFGLLNNVDHDVRVYFDEQIVSTEMLVFHPNDNTQTWFIKTGDVMKFVQEMGFEPNIVAL